MKPFDLDFIVQGLSDRAKSKTLKKSKKGKNVGLTHVNFRDFIPKTNGGAVLVGEYIVTGEEATTALGSVTATGTANVFPTGVESTGAILNLSQFVLRSSIELKESI